MFSLVDDNSVKDLPSSAAEIAAGFQNPNAFYIGNAELEAINIKSAKMCLERSKARGDSECNTNCLDIVDSHWSSCDAHAIFSSGTKNVMMAMTGQLAMGSCSSFYDGQTGCDSTTGDYCWSCGRNGKVGQASSIQNNWHAHNYGMNLRRDGGTDELYHYTMRAVSVPWCTRMVTPTGTRFTSSCRSSCRSIDYETPRECCEEPLSYLCTCLIPL